MKEEVKLSEEDYKFITEAKTLDEFQERISNVENGLEYALETNAARNVMQESRFLDDKGDIDIETYKIALTNVYENEESLSGNYQSDDDYLVHEAFYQGSEQLFYDINGSITGKTVYFAKRMNRKNSENFKAASKPEDGSIISGIQKLIKYFKGYK